MLRLLWWFVRVVIVGRRLKLCVRGGQHEFPINLASQTCGSGLCVACCEARCQCLDVVVKQTKELQA
jgi:hypothetical protein